MAHVVMVVKIWMLPYFGETALVAMKNSKYLVVAVVLLVGLLYCVSGALPYNSSSETSSDIADQHQQCPTWFFWNVTSRKCECHTTHSVFCSQEENLTQLLWLCCMTYDIRTDSTALGYCPYGDPDAEHDTQYFSLPQNTSELNEAMCGKANREGLLCSRCKSGYGPTPLSYDHSCARCSNGYFGWFLYLCAALIPTTVFILVIALFQVRTTSAPLNFFVFACQLESVTLTEYPHEVRYHSEVTKFAYGIGATLFFTSWNLDYFRLLIPPFCVSESLSNLQVLSMDYIVAFYPLFLTVVMYICIQQHARGCRPLVCLWRPFGYCTSPLVKRFNWNPATSTVHIFASFLILSSSKVLAVSFNLLYLMKLTNMSSIGAVTIHANVLYYDPNITFFSQDHLPYAILAIFVSSTFVILPCLVLILYPTRLFQKFLTWSGIGCHAVHAFADAFNGCYKNGTNGTRDYRCFAGFYLLVRLALLATYPIVHTHSPIAKLLLIVFVFIFALASPYKYKLFNVLDSFGLTLLACRICIPEYRDVFNVIGVASLSVYFVALVSCTVILKFNCCCSQKLKALADWMSGVRDTSHIDSERQEVTDHLPDRLENPDGYRLLT